MTPDISIVMAVFNVENFLGATLESVLLQNHGSFEVVIVDDRSTDGTKRIAEQYAALDRRIRVLTNEGAKGAGGGRNTAMAHMRGKTCFFLDGDDLLLPEALASLHALFEQTRAPLVRGIGTRFCQQRWLFLSDPLAGLEPAVQHLPAEYPTAGFCHHLYDSEFLRKNAVIFPEHLIVGQDAAFLCHAYSLVETVPFINRNVFVYRINHKRVHPSGVKSISAINYFLLAREYFDNAGKHRFVAPYLESRFQPQWLERAHAAWEDGKDTALLFMEKCAALLHDMERETGPFLNRQLGAASGAFWERCRKRDAEGVLAVVETLAGFKPQPPFIGIDKNPDAPGWRWYLLSRRLANLARNPGAAGILRYFRELHNKSVKRLASGAA